MSEKVPISSKVLLYEADEDHMQKLRLFFEQEADLTGLRARSYDKLKDLLQNNIDLGGVFLGSEIGGMDKKLEEIAAEIHRLRPELPIFLRVEDEKKGPVIDGTVPYQAKDTVQLQQLINEYIFNFEYPNSLVRGIQDISTSVLESIFPKGRISCGAPYLVRDRFVYGTLFSMIPLVSRWCNGYMILEGKECDIKEQLGVEEYHASSGVDFRTVNSLLGEITNRIWGGVKARFVNEEDTSFSEIQVPILVNHEHRYLSFGTANPQLCFRYSVYNEYETEPVAYIYQKFVFHLNWSPEAFQENAMDFDNMLAAGELELL